MAESAVEGYLRKEVKKAGGACYKFVSPGRRHVPDDIVLWPAARYSYPVSHFVECKDRGRKARPGQQREHARLRALGQIVFIIDTKAKVDLYIKGELSCL